MSTAAGSRPAIEGPLAGALVAGKYRVERILREGGTGRVLAAENVATGKKVALSYEALLGEAMTIAPGKTS